MSSSASNAPSGPTRAPGGWAVALAAAAIGLGLVTFGASSLLAFGALAAAAVALAAYAAARWPLATLTVAALSTLLDGEVTPRMIPPGIDVGPIGLSEPLLLAAGIVIGWRALAARGFGCALRDPVLAMAVVFVGLGIVSALVNAVPPHIALLGIVVTVDALAVYALARMIDFDERGASRSVAIVIGAAVAIVVIGLAQVVVVPTILGFSAQHGQFGEGLRITSILGSPNMVAAVIGITLPFLLFASRRAESSRTRWMARIGLVLFIVALLLTYSRGGWLAVGLGGVVGALLLDWRAVGHLALAGALAWAMTLAVPDEPLFGAPLPSPSPASSVASGSAAPSADASPIPTPSVVPTARPTPAQTPAPTAGSGSIIDSTIDRILSLWNPKDTRGRFLRDGMRVIVDHPVLGVGPGRYGGAVSAIFGSPVYEEYGTELFTYRTVHNFWLHLLAERGALGLAAFLALVIGLFMRLRRAARSAAGMRFVILAGSATMLIVASLHSVTEMIFEGNMPALIVWLLLGIASVFAPAVGDAAAPDAPGS